MISLIGSRGLSILAGSTCVQGITRYDDVHDAHEQHFYEYLDDFVIIYIDNTLVYSKTAEEHAEHLEKVFQSSDQTSYVQRETSAIGASCELSSSGIS